MLADLASPYHDVDVRLFGRDEGPRAAAPEEQDGTDERAEAAPEASDDEAPPPTARSVSARSRQARVWNAIGATPDFWVSLKPLEEGSVRCLHEMTLQHRWEVFFITQRPSTRGETVQRQTQRWLVAQGFDLPSALVLAGSRGAAAGALELDYHVDDNAKNCLDVIAESGAQPILIVPDDEETTRERARELGIWTAPSFSEGLDLLGGQRDVPTRPRRMKRLAAMVGWK